MQGRTAVAQELTSLAWSLGKLESSMYMYMYNEFYNYTMHDVEFYLLPFATL